MKKTLKKQLILLAVITVMMLCALAVPGFAADGEVIQPCVDGQGHKEANVIVITYAPSCEEYGYDIEYCVYCQETIKDEHNIVDALGHNYAVSYVADGDSYDRVRTCQRTHCKRADAEIDPSVTVVTPSQKGQYSVVTDAQAYYSVEFVNKFESPVAAQTDHKDYFYGDYYVSGSPSTWLATSYLTKVYEASLETNDNGAAVAPAYEFIKEGDAVRLYVKDGEVAPVYAGAETPYRYKDLSVGEYKFSGWKAGTNTGADAITSNTVFEAQFASQTVNLVYRFWSNGVQLSDAGEVAYGGTVADYDHATPTMAGDAAKRYRFIGWYIGSNRDILYSNLTDLSDATKAQHKAIKAWPAQLYHNTELNAAFEAVTNKYTVKFFDYTGTKEFEAARTEDVVCGKTVEGINKITSDMVAREKDKQYVYAYSGQWEIKSIAYGDKVYKAASVKKVDPHNLDLPSKLLVINENNEYVEVAITDGCTISLVPNYFRNPIQYEITVSIKTVYFEQEDQFPDEDSGMIRSDILDDFNIQVTNADGQWIVGGRTDANGDYTFKVNYSEKLYITAKSENGKYEGVHELYLGAAESSKFVIGIAPVLSEEWKAGNTHSCSCICHSFLSPIVIRIYNILYRLFGTKYVCCDDLFAAHGSILAYTR